MNERPTPETDAHTKTLEETPWSDWVYSDFVRKLERERDEAREAAEKWRKLHDTKDELFKKGIAEVERERDEAREENKKFREALEWIAERYDDSKPMHSVAMDAYEMTCTARAALRMEEAK